MSEGNFQVIAATPRRTPDEVARLADRIGDIFDVDLASLLQALTTSGVCVTTAATLQEARAKGAKIVGVGGDYRVLDGAGKQVDQGEAKGRIEVAPRMTPRSSRTIMGVGTHLTGMAAGKLELEDAGGFAGAESTVAQGATELGEDEGEEILLEDSGGFAAIDSSIAKGGVELSAPGAGAKPIPLDDTGGFAAMDSSIAEGAVALDAPAEAIELESGAGGFASPEADDANTSGIAVPAGPDKVELEGPGGFLSPNASVARGALPVEGKGLAGQAADVTLPVPPPVLVEPAAKPGSFDLDSLDGDALVMLDGTGDEPDPVVPDDAPAPAAQDDSAFLPPEEDQLDMDALDIDLPSPGPPPATAPSDAEPASIASIAPIVGDVVEVPMEQGQTDVGAAAPVRVDDAPATPPPAMTSSSSRPAPASAGSRKRRAGGSFSLLDGWFSERPRVRVIIGFAAALVLASALPLCHARSIRTSRIEELRVDLATAKAHGPAVAGDRTPGEIEASISSLETRHTIYALAMWCALMALLLFLWFRFT